MKAKIGIKKIGRNDLCWCGSGKKYKNCCIDQDRPTKETPVPIDMSMMSKRSVFKGKVSPKRIVPAHIKCPDYAETGDGEQEYSAKVKLSVSEIEQMRYTCRAARRVGGYPSPLNYNGFPKSVCTSVNEVICHGIPDDRPLENGDIVNIDVTIFLNGLHGDCSETVSVGKIDQAFQNLLTVTYESMMRGIAAIRPNGLIGDIGRAIEMYVKEYGYSVVRAYCGHGIGRLFHSSPSVPHYYDPREHTKIKPGMIFTVEPMINMGTSKSKIWEDGWTAVTYDLQRSAQFEHTVLVTQNGVDILTLLD